MSDLTNTKPTSTTQEESDLSAANGKCDSCGERSDRFTKIASGECLCDACHFEMTGQPPVYVRPDGAFFARFIAGLLVVFGVLGMLVVSASSDNGLDRVLWLIALSCSTLAGILLAILGEAIIIRDRQQRYEYFSFLRKRS